MNLDAESGLTRTGYVFVGVVTTLSVGHHMDHVLRGVTGWPLEGGFNPFSASLFIYPVLAIGIALSLSGRVGARFWSVLAAAGAIFLLVVHVGPGAGDSIGDIPGQYRSEVAGALAVTELVALIGALCAHSGYELWRLRRLSQ